MQEHYPEIDVDELARELNKLLPASFPLSREELARLIRQCSLKRELSAAETGQLGQLQHELDGKPIQLSNAQIVFGSENSIGDIKVGDIAGGNIIKIIVNPSGRSRFVERDFSVLIERLTKNFIGRKFIFDEIQTQLQRPDFSSGYIQLIGVPGIGKSSIAAKLVKDHGYIHHFNTRFQPTRSTTRAFLENVYTQIINRYKLPYCSLPDEAVHDSGFFTNLLNEAERRSPTTPLIVVVDALDESEEVEPGNNRLSLPNILPDGVYMIVTTRPERRKQFFSETLCNIFIKPEDPRNEQDIKEYIEWFLSLNSDAMVSRLREWNVDTRDFIEILSKVGQGNFMYIKLVLPDIANGILTRENVGGSIYKLPEGLEGYYSKHWEIAEANSAGTFSNYDKPVICAIGAAKESVRIDQLEKWVDVETSEIINVINRWSPFLSIESRQDGEEYYSIYHASFWDFLYKKAGFIEANRAIKNQILSKRRRNRD